MGPKFIIVNNGMTELRGHYFETGISIAREAEKRSFHAAMATHVTCEATELTSGLGFYPLFRVDHWGIKVAEEVPGMYGLRGSSSAVRQTTIDDVFDGRTTMEQYLLSRFEPPQVTPSETNVITGTIATSRRARIKQAAKRILPPVAAQAVRWLVRNRHLGKRFAKALVPPVFYDGLKRTLRGPKEARAPEPAPVRPADSYEWPISHDSQVETHLKNALSRSNADREAELWPLFLRDLDRLLCIALVRPEDHIYLPTAHGRDAFAVRRLIQEIGEERSPTFHLEFRHAIATLDELEKEKQNPNLLYYTKVHQAFFDACRAYPDTAKMRYYTDTDELAADYGDLTGFDFRVLPIPFRAELIPQAPDLRTNDGALKILFLGDVREEKGFQLLPGLVKALFENDIKTGRMRFIIQAGIHPDEASPALRGALEELEKYSPEHVELVGREGFLTPSEYYVLLGSSDVVLCPYLADFYRARSSGILAEAIVAGKPTVVRAGTWLARQQRRGSGETFTDLDSLVDAVRSVCGGYREYQAGAQLEKERWQQNHSPARLLDSLLGPTTLVRADAA